MSDGFILFRPKAEVEAEQNLAAFISLCRDELKVFGADLQWNAAVWPKVGVFSKLGVTTRRPAPDQCLDSAFIEFAKAYFRYQQGVNPTGTKNELKALGAVEAALLQVTGSANIANLSFSVLDEAATLAKSHYGPGAAYQCGREIQRLSAFVTEHRLVCPKVHTWVSPIRKPKDSNRTGAEAKELRARKLPHQLALEALAEIFAADPDDPRDTFTSSTFALLMSAPSRISEVLALPVDCEVYESGEDGVERYGWRFFAGKGFEGDIKWIPTVMVPVAKTAIARLKRLSADARRLAKWIEENPGKFYRHPMCPPVADDVPLSAEEACLALGLECRDRSATDTSLRNRKLSPSDGVHTLQSLWTHVMSRLPEGFPWLDKDKKIKFSGALFALNKNQLHAGRATLPVELWSPSANIFNNDLSPREALNDDSHRSLFDRHNYRSEDGGRLKLTSHQARHLLNTIAQRGGLSNLEIAKWSGRADVRQNRTYNHMTDEELVKKAESLSEGSVFFGPDGGEVALVPATSLAFSTVDQGAAHVTEYGFCTHDYALSPCDKYLDCLNCTEHVCIKGNKQKLERIKERLEKTESLMAMAGAAMADGDMGADRWYEYHERTLARLRQLVDILESPDTEEGSQIKLRGNDFTQLRRVVQKRCAEVLPDARPEHLPIHDLSELLGLSDGKTSQ